MPSFAARTLQTPTPLTADSAFTLVAAQLGTRGYAIQNADRRAGFITAERQRNSSTLFGMADFDRLSINFGAGTVTITAATWIKPLNGPVRPHETSDTVQADAAQIAALLGKH
jgi:hypothetical protein